MSHKRSFSGKTGMLIGYARVSKSDGSQTIALQKDALLEAGVPLERIYSDHASGILDDRPGLKVCLEVLRPNDSLVVWKLDRLGRNLAHLVSTVDTLSKKNIGLKVLSGAGGGIDTSSSHGRLIFGVFASLAEFERELIRERTMAGLNAARARGRQGGRPYSVSQETLKMLQGVMVSRMVSVNAICKEFHLTKTTLYRLISPDGQLRPAGLKLLTNKRVKRPSLSKP